jgi:hypothetical protein
MKELDEIMASDRKPTYADLLVVQGKVEELEADLRRTRHADDAKVEYILHLREEMKALVAQRNASLDPLVRAKMMAPAPAIVVHLPTLAQLAQAFEMWEWGYRANPTQFLTEEAAAAHNVSELSANRASHFQALLGEVLL